VRGIEAACWGTIGSDIDLRTSKAGKPFANFNLAVNIGTGEDDRPLTQWLRVAIFGELAQTFAERTARGDRAYVEGSLTLNTWTTAAGETKTGLNLAAWRCEKLPAIGRNRQFREKGHAVAAETFRQPDGADYQLRSAGFQAQHQRPRPKIQGRDEFDLNDPIPF
jgi:single stranded DNA-binding protein